MQITTYVADQTGRIADALCHYLETTAPERLDWKPELPGSAPTRSIFEQVAECADVNRFFAALLTGSDLPAMPETRTYPGLESAKTDLQASVEALKAALLALEETDLAREYPHPRGPLLGTSLILTPYRNMAYHAGQINFYQILSGDAEFHAPPNWRK